MQTKFCNGCNQEKELSEYSRRASGVRAGQIVSKCKPCRAVKQSNLRVRDKTLYDRVEWPSKIKRMYGITPDIYEKMLEAQGGKCAICGTSKPGGGKRRFMIDHCHDTKKVRGLLCQACNRALGLLKDSPESAMKAAAYLAKKFTEN